TGGDSPGARVTPAATGPGGRLLACLGAETLGVDQLATRLGLTPAETLGLLTEMELGGLLDQLPGMRFRRAA
ncbi:MAG: DNA-protecting protein DprA, partial [Longimicrobiales bacterium]